MCIKKFDAEIFFFVKLTTLCNQLLSELTLDLFNILLTCYMHIEDVHEEL